MLTGSQFVDEQRAVIWRLVGAGMSSVQTALTVVLEYLYEVLPQAVVSMVLTGSPSQLLHRRSYLEEQNRNLH